ncbi:putative mitochondrial biogenesis protein AIM24 [Rosa chinensis]|uniref:Putative mitochondrial biogenesis protein AIM24 n=1 Tax=Rosa chinensis TaxID=74649 RepID=A0A2P6P8J2_ROSCH|nr:putative mitochondrial biogenesis protein AIM24 [Rosa chinensis]
MAAPFFSTPFQPYVYQSPQDAMIPFQILGGEAQLVQIMLKPEEKVIAKPGSMCFMSGSIKMENVFVPENEVGVWQWLFGKTIDLAMFGGEILCQMCSVNDVKVSNKVDQRARNIIPGAEGFLRQKLSGQGLAFIIAGGSVVQKNLDVGEVLSVDVSCIAAVTTTVNVQIKYNGPMRRAVFGGDNLVTAVLTGPGIVFIQSLPFHRFSQRIARAVTSPNMRENPKFVMQIAIFFFLAYVVIISSLILTDV